MKNSKSEKNRNAKGFYVALGISALMIGSACYFSYKEGDSKYPELSGTLSSSDYAVDRRETDIPKATTTRRGSSYLIVTTTTADNYHEALKTEISTVKETLLSVLKNRLSSRKSTMKKLKM